MTDPKASPDLRGPPVAYRYTLTRDLCDLTIAQSLTGTVYTRSPKTVLFVMLNPSTADETTDDPTIRRCMGFARREGGTRLEVVNLFAQRATKPKHLRVPTDLEERENLQVIVEAVERADVIVCAWGANAMSRRCYARSWLLTVWGNDKPLRCLGKTADGSPRHPLFVPADQPLEVLAVTPTELLVAPVEHEHAWFVGCRGCDEEPDVSEHFVTFDESGWTIEHSLQCRMTGEMHRGCSHQHAVLAVLEDDHDNYGRWRITDIDSEGLPSYERAP